MPHPEPEGTDPALSWQVCAAGARRLVREGVIGPRECAVAILTGHLLKDPEILLRGKQPREIEPRLAALEEVLNEEW